MVRLKQRASLHCKILMHTLNLGECRGVTDVARLVRCASLHTLNLGECRGVTDVARLGLQWGSVYPCTHSIATSVAAVE